MTTIMVMADSSKLVVTKALIGCFLTVVFLSKFSYASYEIPEWKQVFVDNKDWQGYYYFFDQVISCKLHVYSVQEDEYGVIGAEFSDDEAEIELSIFLDTSTGSNRTMKFRLSYVSKTSERFPTDVYFEMLGKLDHHSTGGWYCAGNITQPADSGFSRFSIHTPDKVTKVKSNEDWALGVKIGVPVAVGVVTIAIGIAIMIWAVRKGYIKHVPTSYGKFGNPSYTSNGAVHM